MSLGYNNFCFQLKKKILFFFYYKSNTQISIFEYFKNDYYFHSHTEHSNRVDSFVSAPGAKLSFCRNRPDAAKQSSRIRMQWCLNNFSQHTARKNRVDEQIKKYLPFQLFFTSITVSIFEAISTLTIVACMIHVEYLGFHRLVLVINAGLIYYLYLYH